MLMQVFGLLCAALSSILCTSVMRQAAAQDYLPQTQALTMAAAVWCGMAAATAEGCITKVSHRSWAPQPFKRSLMSHSVQCCCLCSLSYMSLMAQVIPYPGLVKSLVYNDLLCMELSTKSSNSIANQPATFVLISMPLNAMVSGEYFACYYLLLCSAMCLCNIVSKSPCLQHLLLFAGCEELGRFCGLCHHLCWPLVSSRHWASNQGCQGVHQCCT